VDAPKISVIVPIYNAEKYLERCINSIVKQTFKKFELLLIDDCSDDKSLEICKKYAQIDKRIKTYHKEVNEGTAQARKTGIFYAMAEYSIFVDNDDWIEPEMLDELYQKIISKNYDMVYCDFYDGKEYIEQNYINCNTHELMRQIISWDGGFYPVTWNKLVKTAIYKKVSFPSTIFSEDRAIMTQVLFYCNNIEYLNKGFYHWCIVQESASRKGRQDIKNLIDDYNSYITIIIFIYENNIENLNEFTEAAINHADRLKGSCNTKIINRYKNSIKEIISIIKENDNDSNKIIMEQNNFEKIVKELDRKNNYKNNK
jgi:glycosyltransferase involved in cell wall biosynthesis